MDETESDRAMEFGFESDFHVKGYKQIIRGSIDNAGIQIIVRLPKRYT
jgi:hypothetical protein